MQFALVLILFIISAEVKCYNILGVFLYNGASHFKVAEPLLKELSARGHNVTVLGFFPIKHKLKNYNDIVWGSPNISIDIGYYKKLHARIAKYSAPLLITSGTKERCEVILKSKQFRNVLETVHEYDLLITEFFDTNCFLYPIVATNKIPFIGIQSHALLPWTNDWVANPHNPSHVPVIFLDHWNNMSFTERMENTLVWIYTLLFYNFVMKPQDYRNFQKHFEKSLILDENVVFNTSMIFTNTHFSLHGGRPFVPNVIEIGGVHIEEPKKLPVNIEKWINESTNGVVYFSFGSMLKGCDIPEEKRQMFIKAFSRIPQRILWKWEADEMIESSNKIMIGKWMPQFEILCHPNVKVFIAHGGLLGITEAVHCGVPLVVVPQFGDQFTNAKAVERSGGGVILDYNLLSEESIYNALKMVLDSSFHKKAKGLSERFRDRPMTPLETAVYWVEYVARHRGAPHLRSAAVGMPLYKYLLLDVIASIVLILILLIYVMLLVIRFLVRKLFPQKEKIKLN